MIEECEHLDLIGKGVWIGGVNGHYACVVPYCKKYGKICNKNGVKECDMNE